MTQEAIEVQFVMGRDEFEQALQSRKPPRMPVKQRAIVGFAVIAGTIVLTYLLNRLAGVRLQAVSVLIGGILVLEYWRWAHRRHWKFILSRATRQFSKQGLVRLEFSDAGLTVSTTLGDAKMFWLSVANVTAAKTCTLIDLGLSTLAIPDEALPPEMSRESFITHLKHWVSAS